MTPLAISHMCTASSLGNGLEALAQALESGQSNLRPCTFERTGLATHVGAVDALSDVTLPPDCQAFDCRNNRLAELALRQDGFEAAVAARRRSLGGHRIGLFLGTSTSGILEAEHAYQAQDGPTLPQSFNYAGSHNTFSLAAFLRQRLCVTGPALVVSCACASTAKAFGNAARMLQAGLCDAAIVGGADTLCLTTLHGFASLALLSAEPCRPWDAARSGISIGEAAGFVLLEPVAAAPGATMLLGIGESLDAYHMSAPEPGGAGALRAMASALQSAGLRAEAIDYVNLHGTATEAGDAAEDRAMSALFGQGTPCSSTKGQTGHTLGAAGILEAIISALALRRQFIPGSPQTGSLDPALRSRYERHGTPATLRTVMSNSFGFGGTNCSLILGAAR